MKKEKKTLSYYTARKIDFALFLTMSAGIIYMLTVSLCGLSISRIVGALICLTVLFTACADFFFKKDRDDELARHDMSVAREMLSKSMPWFIIAVSVIFFIFFRSKKFTVSGFDILLAVVLQPSLYLTVEQGLFLFIHGRESCADTEESEDE